MKNPYTNPFKRRSSRKTTGFTLVEVLIVVVIISALLTLAGIGLGNLTAGKNTSSAIINAELIFEEARIIAVSKGCQTMVLIDADDPNTQEYKRQMLIAHQAFDDEDNPIPDTWVIANRGYRLPIGVYFSDEYSRLSDNSSGLPEIELTSPDIIDAYRNKRYLAYTFNNQGIAQEAASSFIIGSGARPPGQEPRMKSSERDFKGFKVWRSGRTSLFKNPEQMDLPTNVSIF